MAIGKVKIEKNPLKKFIELDIYRAEQRGSVTRGVAQDVSGQNAFPFWQFNAGSYGAIFSTFVVPSDWDPKTEFEVDLFWYPTAKGDIKWAIVHARKDSDQSAFRGFNRNVQYFKGAPNIVTKSTIRIQQGEYGPKKPGDLMTLAIERLPLNPEEESFPRRLIGPANLIGVRLSYFSR